VGPSVQITSLPRNGKHHQRFPGLLAYRFPGRDCGEVGPAGTRWVNREVEILGITRETRRPFLLASFKFPLFHYFQFLVCLCFPTGSVILVSCRC
jgi:hypothetical protein